jgi:hypothetical protein
MRSLRRRFPGAEGCVSEPPLSLSRRPWRGVMLGEAQVSSLNLSSWGSRPSASRAGETGS